MAKLYIREYANVASVGHTSGPASVPGQAPQETCVARQTVDFTSGQTASSAFNAKTTFVRLHTDGICLFDIGASPNATSNGDRMAANQTEYFGVQPGMGHTVSVVTTT